MHKLDRTRGWASALQVAVTLTSCMACQNNDAPRGVPGGLAPPPTPFPATSAGQPALAMPGTMASAGAGAATGVSVLQPSTEGALDQPLSSVDVAGVRGAIVGRFLDDVGDGWRNQVSLDWELPAGRELYLCARINATEDVYFNALSPLNPRGTHHVSVSLADDPQTPEGVTVCDVNEIGTRQVGGSGVGTMTREFPPGIAMKIDRGTQLILNLHLFNPYDAPLRGRSGSRVRLVAPEEVEHLADSVVAVWPKLMVPPGHSVQRQTCTVDRDYTVLSLFPHMHQTGVHMKVVAHRGSEPELVLHDAAYDFDQQLIHRIDSLAMRRGDRFDIECTYDNPTGRTLKFGESTLDEMCVLGLVRYPAGGESACLQ